MRTLKKTLALVLCLAMVAGLCCFGTSAAFADQADIEKTEAVAVMNALGVLKGDGTNYNPKGILTRAEAAVMLAKLIGEGNVKSTSTYKDMAGYEWAQQYAAVCEAKGFILGDGAGNFLPGTTLTGYQFGLMLCRALGYKPAQEGVEAATYEIGTAALMKKIGLTDAIPGFDGTAGLTRENAAALMLKALQTKMVEYSNAGTTITGGGFTITTGASTASDVANNGTELFVDDNKMQMCEAYFPTLQLSATTGDVDAFGRLGNTWTYKGATVGTYSKYAPAYTATVTNLTATANPADAAAVAAALNKVLGITATNAKLTYTASSATFKINGSADLDGTTTDCDLQAGDVVEVYTDITAPRTITQVVVLRQSYGKILNVVANTGKLKASKVDANGDAMVYNYKITIDTNGDTTADITTNDLDLIGYTADYVKGAYLNLYNKSGVVLGSSIAKTETGAVTAFTATSDATMNGTKYYFANASIFGNSITADFVTGNYTLVLDDAGFVTAVVTNSAAAATLSDVVYTNGVLWFEDSAKYGMTTRNYFTQIVKLDGTVEDINVGGIKVTGATTAEKWGVVSSVTVKSSAINKVTTTAPTAGLNVLGDVAATATTPACKSLTATAPVGYTFTSASIADGGEIKSDATKFDSKYITADTTFMQVAGSGAATKAAVYTGSMGYKNTTGSAVTAYYVYDSAAPGANGLVAVVIPVAAVSSTTESVLYVAAGTSTATANGYLQANVYDLAGNKLDAITVVAADNAVTGFVTYVINDKGIYDLTTVGTESVPATDWSKSTGVKYFDGVQFAQAFDANNVNLVESTNTLYDVPAAAAVVVDLRLPAAKVAGYNADLTSVADILAANATIKTGSTPYAVVGDVYLSATGVATIFVTSVG